MMIQHYVYESTRDRGFVAKCTVNRMAMCYDVT